MQYSELIYEMRKKLNISQEELAHQLDVSFATVNRWETGKYKPSRMAIKTISLYCSEHNIDVESLIGSDTNENK